MSHTWGDLIHCQRLRRSATERGRPRIMSELDTDISIGPKKCASGVVENLSHLEKSFHLHILIM